MLAVELGGVERAGGGQYGAGLAADRRSDGSLRGTPRFQRRAVSIRLETDRKHQVQPGSPRPVRHAGVRRRAFIADTSVRCRTCRARGGRSGSWFRPDGSGAGQRIAGDLTAAGFDSRAVAQPLRWKYAKLLGNLVNAIDALCGRMDGTADIAARARAEGVACYAAAGIEFAANEEGRDRHAGLPAIRAVGSEARQGGSSWQSLARGTGTIEADYLNGEIALLGRMHGVPNRPPRKYHLDKQCPGTPACVLNVLCLQLGAAVNWLPLSQRR